MIHRRELFGSTAFAGLVGTLVPHGTAPEQASDRSVENIAHALEALRTEIRSERLFSELDLLRDAQKAFLRANGKYPDFLDVGIDVWYAIYDWHVRWRQPIVMGRDNGGRYTLLVMQTTVVMRPDAQAAFVGVAYDNK